MDIIVLVRGPFHTEINARARQTIDTLWSDLNRRRLKNGAHTPGPAQNAE
jgi:hypothetical protein